MRIFLSAYTVRVNKKGKKDDKPDYQKLSTFNEHDDFYDVMKAFLSKLTVNPTNTTYKTYLKTIRVEPEGRSISGVIESGIYGLASNIRDVDTDSLTYKKRKNDADVLPFYFLIYIPEDTNEGILLLQRTGKYGIRSNLGTFLNAYFSKEHSRFSVEVNFLIQEELIKRILYGGIIKKLRCVKYQVSTDKVDGLDEGHEEIPFSMEVVLSANRIPFMAKIQEFFEFKCNVKNLIEIRDFNFDYDTVKVEVDIDGRLQTFDLGDLDKARNHYDVSSQIVMDADERPTFQSMQQVAKNYLEELIEKTYQ